MLFWLGSIEFETPQGRFILTGASAFGGSKRRPATEEEAAQLWAYLERHLMTASRSELRPWYELYHELASEPYYGHRGEPHASSVLDAVRTALWSKQLVFQAEEPFGPLPELEWEPPKLVPKGPPALTPSELWGRRNEATFIGIRIKDQTGALVSGSRVRVELPDGSSKVGSTNSKGEVEIAGFTQDGTAKITLLDHNEPGKSEAPKWPEEKEFKVTVVDEMKNPVTGVWLQFRHGKAENLAITDGDGTATYKTSDAESVTVTFESTDALTQVMRTVWNAASVSQRDVWVQPEEGKTTVVSLRNGKLERMLPAATDASAAMPAVGASTIPDVKGATAAAKSAAASAAGQALADQYEAFDSIALKPGDKHQLSVQPHVTMVRLVGISFDTEKSFLLPSALLSLRRIGDLYAEHAKSTLMLIGHADSSGGSEYNEALSLERAEAMLQYLRDDVDAWLAHFEASVPAKKRWGAVEERQMLRGLVARKQGLALPRTKEYQEWHNAFVRKQRAANWEELAVDGELGPLTRAQLVGDYMNLDGTTLPSTTRVVTHGCGNAFELAEPDAKSIWSRYSYARNRRVEFLFFDSLTGPIPEPTSSTSSVGSLEYPTWLSRAEIEDLATEDLRQNVVILPITDVHFRTGSAVMLPEGESPTTGTGTATTSVGALAMALRFNSDRPYHHILVAGHTDSVGSDKNNQKLSEQRAEAVFAILAGNRSRFAELAVATGKTSDWKQILRWVRVAFASLEAPIGTPPPQYTFADCDPRTIDDNAATGVDPLKAFQRAYNANKTLIGASGNDLAVDGSMGKETWGAIFECYQFNMAQELCEVNRTEDESDPGALRRGLADLQKQFGERMLMSDKPWIGFGEKFPAQGCYVNNLEAVSNRRTEILFFDEGQDPNVAVLRDSPDDTELYSQIVYDHQKLDADSARRGTFAVATVYVRLDVFAQSVDDIGERLYLSSPERNFNSYRTLHDYQITADGYIDVIFDKTPKHQNYNLDLLPRVGIPQRIFTDLPFDQIDGWTDTSPTLANNDPLEPEPEVTA